MDDQLRRLLNELDDAIRRTEADGRIDESEQADLHALVRQMEAVLASPEGEHEGVVEHLESATIRFETGHPTIAAIIRSAVDTLTGYGM